MKIRIRKGNKLGTLTTDRLIQNDQIQKISRSPWSLWPNGRESEHGIRSSEARFLMGTQNFFIFPMLVTRKKTSFSILQRALD